MNNVAMEILLIVAIFASGVALCLTVNITAGIGFIVIANIALPSIIKLSQFTALQTRKL